MVELTALANLTNAGGLAQTLMVIVQGILVAGVIGVLFYFLIMRPKSFKDEIEIWDQTAGGIVVRRDKGKWKEDQTDGTGYYTFLRDKKVRLKQPDLGCALPTKNGKYKYTFIKTGEGPFNYALVPPNIKKQPETVPIPLADIDWARHELKKAVEKRTLSGFWNENKATILFGTVAVFSLLIIYWMIGMAGDAVQTITGSVASNAQQLGEIATALQNVANQLTQGGNIPAGGVTPPPGF